MRITEFFIECEYCDFTLTDHRRSAKEAIRDLRKDGWRTIENAGYYRVLKGFGGLWDTYYNVDRLQELTDLCRKCETEFTLLTEKE